MSEKNEQERLTSEDKVMQNSLKDTGDRDISSGKTQADIASVETRKSQTVQSDETQRVQRSRHLKFPSIGDTPPPLSTPSELQRKKVPARKAEPIKLNKKEVADVRAMLESCRQLCLSLFLRERDPLRSLGFTSSIEGE